MEVDDNYQKQGDVYSLSQVVSKLAHIMIQEWNEKPGASLSSLLTAANFDIVFHATKTITIQNSNALTLAEKSIWLLRPTNSNRFMMQNGCITSTMSQ